jgi:hypothetical protein
MVAVALLPLAAGLTGTAYRDAEQFAAGFRTAMWVCAAMVAAGGVAAAVLVRNQLAPGVPGCAAGRAERQHHCAVDGPPIEPRALDGVPRDRVTGG